MLAAEELFREEIELLELREEGGIEEQGGGSGFQGGGSFDGFPAAGNRDLKAGPKSMMNFRGLPGYFRVIRDSAPGIF
jgi:hypothetical protein